MTKRINVGEVPIGGGAPISIQSMTNTDTADVEATVAQILRLEAAGCMIVRASVYNEACAAAIGAIRERIHIPLVADIHFDHRLAIAAMEQGVDKLRINPGNIGSAVKVRELVACAKARGVPIRVGVNSGSLARDILEKYGGPCPEAMVESALRHVAILEREGFYDTVISLKSSSVPQMVEANRLIHARVDYPLHLGVTEAGAGTAAVVKSAVGIGTLLLAGIGDTIRVSITGDPVQEVEAAKHILCACGLQKEGVEIISCPTCGRTEGELLPIVERVRAALPDDRGYLKVAIMGCVVNGPGEAREADIGLALGKGKAALFRQGEKYLVLPTAEAVERLITEATLLLN